MPLPWKKVKITQLVNDHFHNSQKRRDGSSLVVETGFPTSLIDLFIKNREKLKKGAKRKVIDRSLLRVEDKKDCFFKGVSEIVALVEAGDEKDGLIVASDVVLNQMKLGQSESVSVVVDGSDHVVREKREFRSGVDVIGVVLKVILVVGLAWGVKKLTLGITLSAFLLFLLDYLGKYVDLYLSPCLESKGVLRMVSLVRSNRGEGGVLAGEVKGERCGEIQVVESGRSVVGGVEDIRVEDGVKGVSGVERGLGSREMKLKELLKENDEFVCLVGESQRKSKKDKIKSKVRKCFVRKCRRFKKDEHCPESREIVKEERSCSSSEDLMGGQFKKEEESESGSGRLSIDTSLSVNHASGRFSETSNEVAVRKEEGTEKLESVRIWSFLVLGLIVLVGLVRGRLFALMLTLTWCLCLKLGETLPRRVRCLQSGFCNKSPLRILGSFCS